MRVLVLLIATLAVGSALPALAASPAEAPAWAFAMNPPAAAAPPPPVDPRPQHVPGSHEQFTQAQIDDPFSVPDWFPARHPHMPSIVASGRRPGVMACGYCHLPNGQGRPENAPLAGLPAAYIIEQLVNFRSGQRLTAGPVGAPLAGMLAIARGLNQEDSAEAASYFAGLRYRPWIRVVETGEVPLTHVVVAWVAFPRLPADRRAI